MAFFATCAGLQIVSGSLVIPAVGAWTADVQLAGQQVVSGTVTVVIGNLTLLGTVYRADVYGGQVRARIVGGYGGWRTQVPAQGYGSSSGVSLAMVLSDAAAACGEQVNVASGVNIGTGYARARFPTSVAGDVLWQMLAQGFIAGWYVDASGVTQTKAWPSSQVLSPFTVTDQKTDEGTVEIATEDYASWMPGCTFSAPQIATTLTSAGVVYTWTGEGEFRFAVLVGTTTDRLLGPLQQIVDARLAPTRFHGRYSYTVSNPTPTTVDASPVNPSFGLPDLQSVPLRADSIASFTPADGGACHIMFLDGVPTAPICVWCEADAGTGPSTIVLGPQGNPTPAVARVNDTCVVFFPPLMQVSGVLSGQPFVGVLAITTPANGIIQTGSAITSAS